MHKYSHDGRGISSRVQETVGTVQVMDTIEPETVSLQSELGTANCIGNEWERNRVLHVRLDMCVCVCVCVCCVYNWYVLINSGISS